MFLLSALQAKIPKGVEGELRVQSELLLQRNLRGRKLRQRSSHKYLAFLSLVIRVPARRVSNLPPPRNILNSLYQLKPKSSRNPLRKPSQLLLHLTGKDLSPHLSITSSSNRHRQRVCCLKSRRRICR